MIFDLVWSGRRRAIPFTQAIFFTEHFMSIPPRDAYHVVIREVPPSQWEWEILRDNRPLQIRMREGLFRSERAAVAAEQRPYASSSNS